MRPIILMTTGMYNEPAAAALGDEFVPRATRSIRFLIRDQLPP